MPEVTRTTSYDRAKGTTKRWQTGNVTMPKDPLARQSFLDDNYRGYEQSRKIKELAKNEGISPEEAEERVLGAPSTKVSSAYGSFNGSRQDEESVASFVNEAYKIASPCAEQLRNFTSKYFSSPLFHHKGSKGEELYNKISAIIQAIDGLSPQNMLPMMSDNTYRGTIDNNAGAMWSPPQGMVRALDARF